MAASPTITILKAGTITHADGQSGTITERDLRDLAASYDAKLDPAPLVVGTPKLDDPAFGWVAGLKVEGGRVRAATDHVDPTFAELVRDGQYTSISASLYRPRSQSNPKPGRWYLRHIAFHGAAAPPIQGLKQVSFGEAGSASVRLPAALCRGVQTRFNLPCGRLMTCDADELTARAVELRNQHKLLSFGDALMVAMLDVALDAAAVSFGAHDPDSEAGRRALSYRMKRAALLSPGISFSEALKQAQPSSSVASFAVPRGWTADADRQELYRRASALQAKEPGLSIMQAAKRIERGDG